MCHFAAAFQFHADIEKSFCLCVRTLRGSVPALRHDKPVVRLGNSDDQAARGDLSLGPRLRKGGCRAAIVRKTGERECLMHVRLAAVFMHTVVGNEPYGGAGLRSVCGGCTL